MRIRRPIALVACVCGATAGFVAGIPRAHSAEPAPVPAPSAGTQNARWIPVTLTFTYRGITAHYSCGGLQDKMRDMLSKLGARDLQVQSFDCVRTVGPEAFPGIRIRMQVLEPDPHRQTDVMAHWHWIDLLANRDPAEVSADCELIDEFRQSVLPAFRPRRIDYHSTCEPRALLPGTVQLKAEVLEPGPG